MKGKQYAYLGDATLAEFAEITVAFPNIVGIGVMEIEGRKYVALGVPAELGDKVCGMYQSIVACYFDDDLRKKVADVVWN